MIWMNGRRTAAPSLSSELALVWQRLTHVMPGVVAPCACVSWQAGSSSTRGRLGYRVCARGCWSAIRGLRRPFAYDQFVASSFQWRWYRRAPCIRIEHAQFGRPSRCNSRLNSEHARHGGLAFSGIGLCLVASMPA